MCLLSRPRQGQVPAPPRAGNDRGSTFLLLECIYLSDLVGFPCRPQNPVFGSCSEGASPGSSRSWQDKPPFLCTQARSDLWCPGRYPHPAHPRWPGGVGAVPEPVATSTLPSPALPIPDISLSSVLSRSGALNAVGWVGRSCSAPSAPRKQLCQKLASKGILWCMLLGHVL